MADWKKLTSTSGAKLDVNMNAVAYISSAAHGATLHFALCDDYGKLVALTVKETIDAICRAS